MRFDPLLRRSRIDAQLLRQGRDRRVSIRAPGRHEFFARRARSRLVRVRMRLVRAACCAGR